MFINHLTTKKNSFLNCLLINCMNICKEADFFHYLSLSQNDEFLLYLEL